MASERTITLSVAHCPEEIALRQRAGRATVAIVVDVIRATTTLAVMFERGARRVWVARDVAEARAARIAFPSALLAGEIAAVAPPGFDYGNSPVEWGQVDSGALAGRDVLFSTTNGARALHACRDARHAPIYAGSLRNATAVSQAALASALDATSAAGDGATILAVCSGRGGKPAEDDSLCAAWLLATLQAAAARAGTPVTLDDAATAALDTLATSERLHLGNARWLYERLLASAPARDVLDVDLGEDIVWCADLDASTQVPTVTGGDPAHDLLLVERAYV